MAVHSITDYSEIHERLNRLRETEIGQDGVISAKGGKVKVNLHYMAACNQSLFKRITPLIQNDQNELKLKDTPIVGVEKMVGFFYSGRLELTEDNLPEILDAAMAMESIETVVFCVNYINNSNVNLWSQFLKIAFRYPLICQPEEFVPNLILQNIANIPRDALVRDLDPTYLTLILEKGDRLEEDREIAMSLFLEMLLNNDIDIRQQKETLHLMGIICDSEDELTIPEDCEEGKVLALLEASLAINFPAFVRACCEYLEQRNPNTDIITKVVEWIPNHRHTLLAECLKKYGCHAFYELPLNLPSEVFIQMIGSDWLELPEIEIFQKSMEWVRHHNGDETRKVAVLEKIRFARMSRKELDDVVIRQYGSDLLCMAKHLLSAIQYHLTPQTQPLLEVVLAKRRLSKPVIKLGLARNESLAPIGFNFAPSTPMATITSKKSGSYKVTQSALLYGPVSPAFVSPSTHGKGKQGNTQGGFQRIQPTGVFGAPVPAFGSQGIEQGSEPLETYVMKSVLTGSEPGHFEKQKFNGLADLGKTFQSAASHVNGFIFICGGIRQSKLMTSFHRYNCHANTWMELCAMSIGRAKHSLTARGSTLLVVGGEDADKAFLSTTLAYDIASNRWTDAPEFPRKTSEHAACRVEDHVYVSGGSCTNKQLVCFSETSGELTWKEKAPMLYGRQCHAMVASGEMLIISGGTARAGHKTQEHVTKVECYDIKLDQWTEMISTPSVPFHSAVALGLNGHIFIFGGLSGDDSPIKTIQKYTIAEDEWKICKAELPAGTHVFMGSILI